MKSFGGKVLFLDRSDINTDEIIPAKYLTEISKEALKPHMLEDLRLEGFEPDDPKNREAGVIVTRANFGCGSSREHAPWVFEVNDINVVIASSFARIFRQNMFNCGMLAIELSEADIDKLFAYKNADAHIDIDFENHSLTISSGEKSSTFSYHLSKFDKALVKAGGWVDFADTKY
ncbi:MAG: 3-isopropylmalate dehydratase small subunit [Nitrospiraceae bacterium]|jgi:3-isopropylmalate/(R)-2-methylmalate dehydratase small subunit|nr:MAG: 3-isopropylmalate dehydratase small subunit [Nitrospiraceae bacterium]